MARRVGSTRSSSSDRQGLSVYRGLTPACSTGVRPPFRSIMKQQYRTGITILAAIAVLAVAQWALQSVSSAQSRATVQAPMYQVDPMWPKPLPNNWVFGSVVGLSIDSRDHIWVT